MKRWTLNPHAESRKRELMRFAFELGALALLALGVVDVLR